MEREKLARLVALLEAGLDWKAAVSEVGTPDMPTFLMVAQLVERLGVSPVGPMAMLLRRLDAAAERQRKLQVALASPRATLRLVVWLPLIALVGGEITGSGSLSVLWRMPIALVAVCLGAALLVVGQIWSTKLVDRLLMHSADESLFGDLLSTCLRAGLSFEAARREVEQITSEATPAAIDEISLLSNRTGMPIARLIDFFTADQAKQVEQKRLIEVEKLSVRLMVPLGVTVLPAFILIAVVPMAISFITHK